MFLKILYTATFSIWLVTFYSIATIIDDFSTQTLSCLFSTMAIFSLSTLIAHWYEKRVNERSS